MAFYYVIDTGDDGEDCSLSWPIEDGADQAEWFRTYKAAKRRAKDLAKSRPGVVIEVVRTIAEVKSKIGKAKLKDK